MASSTHDEEQPSQPSTMSWKEKMELLFVLLSIPLLLVVFVDFVVRTVNHNPMLDRPARYSVELVGASGIGPALAPGAEPLAFKLLVHVDNGHIFDMQDDGGNVVVSYAGVPLARGRAPAFRVETKKAATVAVDAISGWVGIPEDLFQLMSEERRSGVAQLEIDLWLKYGLFTCSVELNGEQRASQCKKQNFVYSS